MQRRPVYKAQPLREDPMPLAMKQGTAIDIFEQYYRMTDGDHPSVDAACDVSGATVVAWYEEIGWEWVVCGGPLG